MKLSFWFLGGLALAGLAGLAFFGVAWLQPGKISQAENAGGAGKPLLAEARKKAEVVRQGREKAAEAAKGLTGLQGSEGEHRVFVSAQLVYLPENAEPVQPLDPKMVTEDGIGVGWKIQHGFDPADPGVRDEDPDGDGFTNFEEFSAKTNPLKKEDSPAKESKLKSRSAEPLGMTVSFPEKSGGAYTLRFQVGTKRKEFKGKPGDLFWVMAGPEGLEIFSDKDKMETIRAKAQEAGQNHHVIPIQFVSYQEKIENIKDAKAGGVEVQVDNSEILLQRQDALGQTQKLILSTAQRPQSLSWDVGDIRLYTPAGGGTSLGPFRMGQTFTFEGKEFSIVGRDGMKIQLLNLEEAGNKTLWVPAEAAPATDAGKPQ